MLDLLRQIAGALSTGDDDGSTAAALLAVPTVCLLLHLLKHEERSCESTCQPEALM